MDDGKAIIRRLGLSLLRRMNMPPQKWRLIERLNEWLEEPEGEQFNDGKWRF